MTISSVPNIRHITLYNFFLIQRFLLILLIFITPAKITIWFLKIFLYATCVSDRSVFWSWHQSTVSDRAFELLSKMVNTDAEDIF